MTRLQGNCVVIDLFMLALLMIGLNRLDLVTGINQFFCLVMIFVPTVVMLCTVVLSVLESIAYKNIP